MKEIDVTDEMLLKARRKAKEMGRLNNSFTNGGGNLIGFIGEEVALSVLTAMGYEAEETNTYDYDITADGFGIDVKTKSTTAVPLETYMCSVSSHNIEQQCDYYAFIRVKSDLTVGWWLGVYSKDDFYKDAVFMKKGDTEGDNNYVVKSDCYNLPISKLKEVL